MGDLNELVERIGAAAFGRHERGFVMWPLMGRDEIENNIRAALTSLIAERDGLARENDISLEELGRIIMTLPTGTRTMGALQGVKELKARALAAEAQLKAAREALEFYAEPTNYKGEFVPGGPTDHGTFTMSHHVNLVRMDAGTRARTALSLDTNKGDGV